VADVNLNIGADGSTIENSDFEIGHVAGRDVNVRQSAGKNRLDQFNNRLDNIAARLVEVEKLLGGNLGMPGLTQQIQSIKEMVLKIKTDMDEISLMERLKTTQPLHPMTIIFLILATVVMVMTVLWTLVVPRF
jgi:hypothetical protein